MSREESGDESRLHPAARADDSESSEPLSTLGAYPDASWFSDEGAEGEAESEPASPRRRWIRNTVLAVVVVALLGNIAAFWPQIYNRQTLPFLFKSQELSARADIQRYKEAVVLVSTDKGKGTGFHISHGYVVTNYHVIEGAAFSLVKFPGDSREYRAEQAGIDPGLDIAILKVEDEGRALPFIEVEREKLWAAGDAVYVIGNPLYFTQIASEGHVLGLVPIEGRERPVLAVDAPVFKGNSGSPVMNEQGKAIAVIYATAELSQAGEEAVQVGLGVPLSDLDRLPDALPFEP